MHLHFIMDIFLHFFISLHCIFTAYEEERIKFERGVDPDVDNPDNIDCDIQNVIKFGHHQMYLKNMQMMLNLHWLI